MLVSPGGGVHADPGQLVGQAALAPVGVAAAQLAQADLEVGRHLVRATPGPMRAVGQPVQPITCIAA